MSKINRASSERQRAYFTMIKERNHEYRQQNKELISVVRFYAEGGDGGALARAALEAWVQRTSHHTKSEMTYFTLRSKQKERDSFPTPEK